MSKKPITSPSEFRKTKGYQDYIDATYDGALAELKIGAALKGKKVILSALDLIGRETVVYWGNIIYSQRMRSRWGTAWGMSKDEIEATTTFIHDFCEPCKDIARKVVNIMDFHKNNHIQTPWYDYLWDEVFKMYKSGELDKFYTEPNLFDELDRSKEMNNA